MDELPDTQWKQSFRRQLRRWYATHARDLPWRRTSDPSAVSVSEIMLQQTPVATVVPYFGACIHVPPPPPNQVVFVSLPVAVAVEDPYGPHWVTGVMRTSSSSTELADAAYTLNGELVEVFDWEAMFPDQADDEDASSD